MNWELFMEKLIPFCIELLYIVIIAVGTVLTSWLISVAKKYYEKLKSELTDEQLNLIKTIITNIVQMINQTFVDSAKSNNNGYLTEEDAKLAYNKAYDLIMQSLSEEQLSVIESTYSDVDSGLLVLIESTVKDLKNVNGKSDLTNKETEN